jgi:hypothetical protein
MSMRDNVIEAMATAHPEHPLFTEWKLSTDVYDAPEHRTEPSRALGVA